MRVRVHYPAAPGEVRLRTDRDWDKDVAPIGVSADGAVSTFALGDDKPFHYFKPILRRAGELRWSMGDDRLTIRGGPVLDVFPHFERDEACHVCTLHQVPSSVTARGYEVRVFLPPGYDENSLERFPVVYMQDGQNLFFADEAFAGAHWRVPETLAALTAMSLVRATIVVGVYPRDRMTEYTAPGYCDYAKFLALELKPWVDAHYRTLVGACDTAVMGSSLGGVASLHTVWEHPEVFGNAGCMSSTFGHRDDLLERVVAGPKRGIRVYIDTGWPRDNYEMNRCMRAALLQAGYVPGVDLWYAAHPNARHDEDAWARRLYMPIQFFFGV
jgi:predicted alpha/beta superfamily hydrolase